MERVLFVSESLSLTYGLVVPVWSWKFHYKTTVGPIFVQINVERKFCLAIDAHQLSSEDKICGYNQLRIFPTLSEKLVFRHLFEELMKI